MVANDEAVNVSDWFYWFSFDVMGEFAFAKSFSMLQDKQWHFAVIMLRKAMRVLGPLSPVPWLAQIGFCFLPWMNLARDWLAMLAWCRQQMTERINIQECKPDVSHWLIDASKKANTLEQDRNWLNGDSVAIIIAGSDTVAPTLVYIFFELAHHPSEQEKLFHEIQQEDIYDRKVLQSLPYLNGVINESLRIFPPIPSGGYRQSPEIGMTIAGKYIPGGITIVSPRYSLGKLESCYEEPHKFVPERWYSKPEMIKDKRAFAPFSQGRYSCVGKTLALEELRFVTALLVKKYDIRFAPGEDGTRLDADLRDQFTAAPGELNLSFQLREKHSSTAA